MQKNLVFLESFTGMTMVADIINPLSDKVSIIFSVYLKHNLLLLLSATLSISASQMVEETMQKELLSAMRIHG